MRTEQCNQDASTHSGRQPYLKSTLLVQRVNQSPHERRLHDAVNLKLTARGASNMKFADVRLATDLQNRIVVNTASGKNG